MAQKKVRLTKKIILQTIKQYFMIIVGLTILALGYRLFLIENKIAAGGLTGIATIIYHLWGLPVGIMILVMNVPLFIAGFFVLGKGFGVKTIFATLMYSVIIDLIKSVPTLTDDLLLAATFGGAMVGIGAALVLRQAAASGGTDLAAKILRKLIPSLTIGQYILIFDGIVLTLSILAFKNLEFGLYAAISIFAATKLTDAVVIGINYSKAVYIITDKSDEIANLILKKVDRGVTKLQGFGGYSNGRKGLLISVMRPRNLTTLKKIVLKVDPDAFVFISDAREVLGNGFFSDDMV